MTLADVLTSITGTVRSAAQPVAVVPDRPGTVVQIAATRLTIVADGGHVKVTVLAGAAFRFQRPKPDRCLAETHVGQIFS